MPDDAHPPSRGYAIESVLRLPPQQIKHAAPSNMRRIYIPSAVLVLAIGCIAHVDAKGKWWRRQAEAVPAPDAFDDTDTDTNNDVAHQAHYLVEMIGKEIYKFIDCRKYRFYIKMMSGYNLPDEREAIWFISSVCNLLYGIAIVTGFLFLPRGPMLAGTLCTLYIGPAVILLLMGAGILTLAAFAIYPVSSVFLVWLWFFLSSSLAQVIGQQLGLDHDGDGDVDFLDILHYLADTETGKKIGLRKLHDKLNRISMDPFLSIHKRLDQIAKKMNAESDMPNNGTKDGSMAQVEKLQIENRDLEFSFIKHGNELNRKIMQVVHSLQSTPPSGELDSRGSDLALSQLQDVQAVYDALYESMEEVIKSTKSLKEGMKDTVDSCEEKVLQMEEESKSAIADRESCWDKEKNELSTTIDKLRSENAKLYNSMSDMTGIVDTAEKCVVELNAENESLKRQMLELSVKLEGNSREDDTAAVTPPSSADKWQAAGKSESSMKFKVSEV